MGRTLHHRAGTKVPPSLTHANVQSNGEPITELGPVGECLRDDGLVLDGWKVWGMMDPAWPDAYFDAGILADGPDGEELAFGAYENGSLTTCHGYVYWRTHNSEVVRWKPGAPNTELILPREHEAIFHENPECSGDTLSVIQSDFRPQRDETGPGTFTTYTLRPDSSS